MSSSKRFLSILSVLILVLLASAPPAAAQGGEILVVNSTATGTALDVCGVVCTFQGAINDSNNMAGEQIINFDILPEGDVVHTILAGELPNFFVVKSSVVIDATSQPGYTDHPLIQIQPLVPTSSISGMYVENQLSTFDPNLSVTIRGFAFNGFTNSVALCLCNGHDHLVEDNYFGVNSAGTAAAPNKNGIIIAARDSIIRNNVISGNTVAGIIFNTFGYASSNDQFTGNFIGTDLTGTIAIPNVNGIVLGGGASGNIFGGATAADRNIISGNTNNGISISGATTLNNSFFGNYIGTDATGASPLGNGFYGILLDTGTSGNQIGDGTNAGANVIAFNGTSGNQAGVGVNTGTQNRISGNSIFGNFALGIDLGINGVTVNDANDGDTGANGLQNFPVVTSVGIQAAQTVIGGTLDSVANHDYTVELYNNPTAACDISGFGEGEVFLGSVAVTTDGSGHGTFQKTINSALPLGAHVTALAIDEDTTPSSTVIGNTSEFSACATENTDLSLTKDSSPDPVLPNGLLTYTLTISNSAVGSTAQNVNLTDTLPTGLTYSNATSTQNSCNFNAVTVSCAIGDINPGDSVTVTIDTTVDNGFAGTSISNTASVTTDTADSAAANNTATETTQVGSADLSLTKADSVDPVILGTPLIYTLTIANPVTETPSQNVHLTDVLPTGITYVLATPSQGTCGYTAGTRTVSCDFGTINNDTTVTVTVNTTADSSFTGASISNTASITSDTFDPDTGNNSATETTQITPADLSVTKVDSVDPATPGSPLTYTLTITNPGGGSNAQNVHLTDVLPTGITYVLATPTSGTCGYTAGTRTVSCDVTTINSGSSVTVTVATTVDANISALSLSNTVNITADTFDPVSANNTATETTQVPHADLSLTKADSVDPVAPGATLTYTLTITNPVSNSDALNVNLTDVLPSGITFGTATPSQGNCNFSTGTVSCAIGTIVSNSSVTVTINTTVDAGITVASISNTASITSGTFDPVSANNSDTEGTQIAHADLRLTMTDAPDPVKVDDILTYTLTVTNLGPNTAPTVTLTDTLPANVSLMAGTPSQGTCTPGAGNVSCDLGSLNSGSSATVMVLVRPLNGTQNTTLTNNATVVSSIDNVPGNNSASTTTAIKPTTGVPTLNLFNVSTPTLTWNAISGATAYEVMVDDATNFLTPAYDNNTIAPSVLFVTISPPLHDGVWYWRVRAKNDKGVWGAWTTNSFTVDVP